MKTVINLGLHKSIIQPIVRYGLACAHLTRASIQDHEPFQKKSFKWVCGISGIDLKYNKQLWLLNILPLPLLQKLIDFFFLSKLYHEVEHQNLELAMPKDRKPWNGIISSSQNEQQRELWSSLFTEHVGLSRKKVVLSTSKQPRGYTTKSSISGGSYSMRTTHLKICVLGSCVATVNTG